MSTTSKPWDRRGQGSREYTDDQWAAVVGTMKGRHIGPVFRITTEALAAETDVPGRTIRAILSDADGAEFCLGGGDDGLYIAESYEETTSITGRLFSQASRMRERAQRRHDYAGKNLPRRQGQLM